MTRPLSSVCAATAPTLALIRDTPGAKIPGVCEAQGWHGCVLLVGLLALGLEAVAKAAAEDAGRRRAAQLRRTVMAYICEPPAGCLRRVAVGV